MAATNYTPIQLYYSSTASAAPTAGNLTSGELAINITDGKLYYKDNGGVVQVIATKGAGTIGGSTTQIQYNNAGALAGSASMTFNSGTNVTTLTTLNLTNALGATYGGTAQSAYAQGDVLYASATNTLSKLGIGTVNYILTSSGSVPQWVAPTSITVNTATNLAGGAGGSVPYQSAADTTTFLAIGAANRVMTSSGTAPQWVTALSGLTGVSSSSITNTSLTSGRVVYSGASGVETDSASLTFNGTTLSAGGFSTTGLSTLVQTVKIGDSNFSGTAVFAAATPAKLYIGTGTVTDATSAIGATNTTGAISSLAITPIAATNTSVTYTNASTLYIAGAPSAGTNITITNPYALYVAAGASYFGGAVTFASSIGALTVSSLTDTGLTSGRVTYATTGGLLTDSANLTFSGTALAVTGSISATAATADTQTTLTLAESGTRSLVLKNPTSTLDGEVATGTNHPLTIGATTSVTVKIGSFGARSTIGTFSSTGLAVTGYITATNTSNTTVASSGFDATTASSLRVVNASTTAGTGAGIYFLGGTNSESYIGNIYDSSGVGYLSFQTRVSGTRAERARINTVGTWQVIGASGVNTVKEYDVTRWSLSTTMLENNTYQRFKVTINDTRVAAQVRIRASINADAGISFHTGSEMLISVGRADGGAFATLQYAFSGSNIAITEPQTSGNDVIFGLTVSNNGTGTAPNVDVVVDYLSASPTSFVWTGVTGTTAGGTSLLGKSKLAPAGIANAVVINSAGLGLGNTSPTDGTGITFPATQSASSDANTLDDYEEGTWTPAWSVSGGTISALGGGTYTPAGTYTKIGNTVYIRGYISYASETGSPSGALAISGLPFTPGTGFGQSQTFAGGITVLSAGLWLSNPPTYAQVIPGSTTTNSIGYRTSTGGSSTTYADMNRATNYSQFVFQGQYTV
jgi:hypothetical protein